MGAELDTSIGAVYMGVIINSIMCGVTLLQTIEYYRRYPNDRIIFKLLVATLLCLNLFHTATAAAAIYRWCITYYGERQYLGLGAFAYNVKSFTGGSTAFLVQCFYSWRIWTFSGGNWWIPSAVMFCAIWQLVWSMFVTARVFEVVIIAQFKEFQYAISCWLFGAAAGDIIITVAMITYLHKKRTAFEKTNNLISNLIGITLGSNAVTALIALVDIITYVSLTNSIHAAFLYNLPNFYINGLLVSLNSRDRMKESLSRSYELSANLSSDHRAAQSSRATGGIRIEQVAMTKVDGVLHSETAFQYSDPLKTEHDFADPQMDRSSSKHNYVV